MRLSTKIAAAIAALVGLAVLMGGPTGAAPTPNTEIQVVDSDALLCLGPNPAGTAGTGDRLNQPLNVVISDPRGDTGAAGWPFTACSGENLAGGTSDIVTGISLAGGSRGALPFTYYGAGFTFTADGLIANGTEMGGIRASIDLNCDGSGHNVGQVEDVFADSSNTPPLDLSLQAGPADTAREPLVKRTLTFTSTSGPNSQDELFLNEVLPSTALFPRNIRSRADATHIFISGGASTVVLGNPAAINVVNMSPIWAGGTTVTVALLEAAGATPKLPLNCLQAPQDSITIGFGTVDPPGAPPPLAAISVAGANAIIPVWTTQLSAADIVNNNKQKFTYTTSCKTIGAAITDTDNDCRADSAEGTAPCAAGGTDSNTGDSDSDDDGLLDGVEVAWGSDPCDTNSDADSRSDLEEIMGPTQFLTDPTDADSDNDLDDDGGLMVDCGVDGIPDTAAVYASAGAGTGRNRVDFELVECGSPALSVEGDSCPTISDGTQANAESTDISNGTILGASDVTQIDGDQAGNVCDADDDNDGIPDGAELTAGFASGACTDTGGGTGTSGTDRDTDNDGTVDGAECQRVTNWGDATSKPSNASITAVHETFYRTQGFNVPGASCQGLTGAPPQAQMDDVPGDCVDNNIDNDAFLTGVTDPDSDNDGIIDAVEVLLGISPASQDSDEDGCSDPMELADINGDKNGDFFDFVEMAKAAFLLVPPDAAALVVADINADNAVDFFDFVAIATYAFIVNSGDPACTGTGAQL